MYFLFRLYDIGVLCSEVTAHYKALSSEWITVLKALCFSSTNPSMGYTELLDELVSLLVLTSANFFFRLVVSLVVSLILQSVLYI